MADKSEQSGVAAQAKGRWATLQAKHPAARHAAMAWARLGASNGSQYAAAITFFSFVALFPLLLLAVAIAGFVLHAHPAALQSLFRHLSDAAPGSAGKTLRDSVQTAIDKRAGVGVIGLIGVLFTGLGWIGNLRQALDAMWQVTAPKPNFVMVRVRNLIVLGGLGLGALVSVGITAGGTALTGDIVKFLHLDGIPGTSVLVVVVGLLVAVVADVVIYLWVLTRLPHAQVARAAGLRGALLAAVGFEILKVVGSYTIKASSSSPTAGPFAGLLAVLVWIQLVSRWLLFCTAWTAVVTEELAVSAAPDPMPGPGPQAAADSGLDPGPVNPVAVGATLVGAGAVGGALAAAIALRRSDARE